MKNKKKYRIILFFIIIALIMISVMLIAGILLIRTKRSIKVGIIHSLTGTMAASEKPVVDATLMALHELNQQGGVLGRAIQPIVIDGKSDPTIFAREVERLITQEKVDALFGCWTSVSRKEVKPIVEKYNHLLVYPVQYEGIEESTNIIYTGAVPNQQIIPGITWCINKLGKRRMFLVGSDYVFPHVANTIIKMYAEALGGEVVGEVYMPLGGHDADAMVRAIAQVQPDIIINSINGDSNKYFFKSLRKAGITSQKIPTLSFSIAEPEIKDFGIVDLVDDYASWSYFQTVDSGDNRSFIQKFRAMYGEDRVVSDPMEAGYFGVFLWADAVFEAQSVEPSKVLKVIKNKSRPSPEGIVSIDNLNAHTWKFVRIGKIRSDGQFDIVWSLDWAVEPVPYLLFYSKEEWEELLMDLYAGWGNAWSA